MQHESDWLNYMGRGTGHIGKGKIDNEKIEDQGEDNEALDTENKSMI